MVKATEVVEQQKEHILNLEEEIRILNDKLERLGWLHEEDKRAKQYIERAIEEDEIQEWQLRDSGFAVRKLITLAHWYKQRFHDVERNFATVVEQAAVTLRAMEMLTRLNSGGQTHRMRDRLSEATILACQEGIDELLKLREQGSQSFGWNSFDGRSFEFRNVALRNERLEYHNKQLVERNRQLEGEAKSATRRLEELKAKVADSESSRGAPVPEEPGVRPPF